MTISVLIVDDSGFFRRRLSELLNSSPDFNVIGTANNGQEAVEKACDLKPDVITMDYEMPVMDGITAVRRIMIEAPTPILMFSSMTYEGARITLDALEAGAVDFMPKNFGEVAKDSAALKAKLFAALKNIAPVKQGVNTRKPAPIIKTNDRVEPSQRDKPAVADAASSAEKVSRPVSAASKPLRSSDLGVIAIGTSTGGPVALQQILSALPGNFPLPILLIQHMPGSFTKAFADRLNGMCNIQVKEAQSGDVLRPGCAYLAPGGKQMMLNKQRHIKILEADDRVNYKPSVDITFASVANLFADKTLAIVLTGMGADGKEGAKLLKQQRAKIWTQDKASCVIYGMPAAVANAGYSDAQLSLDSITSQLAEMR